MVNCVKRLLSDEIKWENVGHQSCIEVSAKEKLFW